MQVVLFTKIFAGQRLEDVADIASQMGFDGVDLLIRTDHLIAPHETGKIAAAVRLFAAAGLTTPLATTDLNDPATYPADRVLRACGEAGIDLVRLGWWKYDPERGYAACFDLARRQLAALVRLAEKTGVRLALQLHGGTIHASGAQAAALLAEYDPRWLGVYPDPGNQVRDGMEDWRFTFDILRPWLSCVGVKNGGWFPGERNALGQRQWRCDWLGVANGMAPWDEIIAALARSGYEGLLSLHSHYEEPLPRVLERTRADLQYVRDRIAAHSPLPVHA